MSISTIRPYRIPAVMAPATRPSLARRPSPARRSVAARSVAIDVMYPVFKAGYAGFAIYFALNWLHYRDLRERAEAAEAETRDGDEE